MTLPAISTIILIARSLIGVSTISRFLTKPASQPAPLPPLNRAICLARRNSNVWENVVWYRFYGLAYSNIFLRSSQDSLGGCKKYPKRCWWWLDDNNAPRLFKIRLLPAATFSGPFIHSESPSWNASFQPSFDFIHSPSPFSSQFSITMRCVVPYHVFVPDD